MILIPVCFHKITLGNAVKGGGCSLDYLFRVGCTFNQAVKRVMLGCTFNQTLKRTLKSDYLMNGINVIHN